MRHNDSAMKSFIYAFIYSVPWAYSLAEARETEMGSQYPYPLPTSQLASGQTLSVVNPNAVGRHVVAVRASCYGNQDDGCGGRFLVDGSPCEESSR